MDAIRDRDETVFEEVRKEVARVFPYLEVEDLEPYDLQRWEAAMPKFYCGWLTQVAEFIPSNGEDGVFLTGDYLNAPWTEGSIRVGQRVAQQLVERDK